jgi:ADP-heptose:LPS heptosyltransferase
MKILIIRFSSFGDVLQTLSVAGRFGESFPGAEIHWVTRPEYVPLVATHPHVRKVWTLPPKSGFKDLIGLALRLKSEGFTHVYDAHNNLRSHVIGWVLNGLLGWRVLTGRHKFLRRSIYRWRRFLLFRFHKNLFPKPFSGQFALLEPLAKWGISIEAPAVPQLILGGEWLVKARALLPLQFKDFVTLAPSAAFELKRWPLNHWKQLIQMFPQTQFVVLGGPEDKFLEELAAVDPSRVLNLAGRLPLLGSAEVIALSKALISNDTGLMHVAEQIGKPCLALMGPAPFGFPSRPRTRIYELDLWCRPCSKHGQGPCVNAEFHKCMVDIRPSMVADGLRRILDAPLVTPLSH